MNHCESLSISVNHHQFTTHLPWSWPFTTTNHHELLLTNGFAMKMTKKNTGDFPSLRHASGPGRPWAVRHGAAANGASNAFLAKRHARRERCEAARPIPGIMQGDDMVTIRYPIPSGNLLHSYWKSLFLMGQSTISMAIFNSYASLPKGN